MILLTGDTHGEIDVGKLSNARRQNRLLLGKLKKEDYLIILGDFGFIWDGSESDQWWLDWLDAKPFTTLFIDGNHENFPLLYQYPVEEWNGGRIHRIRNTVMHLMRGQVFQMQGKTFFTMGGAASHDREYRTENESWWPQEMPSEAEFEEARRNLDACGWKTDFILTHSMPSFLQSAFFEEEDYSINPLTDFLEEVYHKAEFGAWYTGHYHLDVMVQADPQFHMLYHDIRRIL